MSTKVTCKSFTASGEPCQGAACGPKATALCYIHKKKLAEEPSAASTTTTTTTKVAARQQQKQSKHKTEQEEELRVKTKTVRKDKEGNDDDDDDNEDEEDDSESGNCQSLMCRRGIENEEDYRNYMKEHQQSNSAEVRKVEKCAQAKRFCTKSRDQARNMSFKKKQLQEERTLCDELTEKYKITSRARLDSWLAEHEAFMPDVAKTLRHCALTRNRYGSI